MPVPDRPPAPTPYCMTFGLVNGTWCGKPLVMIEFTKTTPFTTWAKGVKT